VTDIETGGRTDFPTANATFHYVARPEKKLKNVALKGTAALPQTYPRWGAENHLPKLHPSRWCSGPSVGLMWHILLLCGSSVNITGM